MKTTYHIPTESYGFIEVELEEAMYEKLPYEEVKSWFQVKDGLKDKEFNAVVDRYLDSGDMDAEAYEALNEGQKDVIQCLKRAFKRIKSNGDE